MGAPPRDGPASPATAGCPARPVCPADPAAFLPRDGAERVVMLALRFVAAAAATGDAACFDAAFDAAEAAFGPRDGALLVARAATLVRALGRDDACPLFLPPPCRHLSPGEASLLTAVRAHLSGVGEGAAAVLPGPVRDALGDLAAPVRSASLGLPWLPPAGAGPAQRRAVQSRSKLASGPGSV